MNHLCFLEGRGSAETKCVFALLAEQTNRFPGLELCLGKRLQ